MFSNGTEYECFLENYCYQCRKFVWWEDATDENPVCPIEESIHEARFDGEKFPINNIKWNKDMIAYCTDWKSI